MDISVYVLPAPDPAKTVGLPSRLANTCMVRAFCKGCNCTDTSYFGEYLCIGSGVNFMILILLDFRQNNRRFSAKQSAIFGKTIGDFLESQCYDQFLCTKSRI
jgi:hypothetical protein